MHLDDLPDDDDWCDQCGAALPHDSLYGRRRFCSLACKRAWHAPAQCRDRHAHLVNRACDQCGASFPADTHLQQRFCSHRCKVKWWSDRQARRLRQSRGNRPCQGCGGQIPPDRQANALYCSAQCRTRTWMRAKRARDPDTGKAAQAERIERIKRARRAAKAERTCEVCQAPIPADKRADAVTCSRRCKDRRRARVR